MQDDQEMEEHEGYETYSEEDISDDEQDLHRKAKKN